MNNPALLSLEGNYPLAYFVLDYYEMEFNDFKEKLELLLGCKLNEKKQSLFHKVNAYADGFFGQNEDYSEDINRLKLDIIKAMQGGCNKRELKSNDFIKRIIHPKASNNNCFFKCIQQFVPALIERISKSECNKIRIQFDNKIRCCCRC